MYEAIGGSWTRREGPELFDPATAAARIPADAVVVGDGIAPYADAFTGRSAAAAPARAEASQVARLALGRLARGERDAIDDVVPLYLRKTEAELKREGRTDV